MKHLKCSDLGEGPDKPDCDFEATGENNQEVIDKMFAHAAEAHADKVAGMTEEQKQGMVQMMNEMLDKQE